MTRYVLCIAACLTVSRDAAAELALANEGQPKVVVFAPAENGWAGQRLVDRVRRWSGVELKLHTGPRAPEDGLPVIAVGTPATNPLVQTTVGADSRLGGLGEQGYLLKLANHEGKPVLIASGKTLAGVNNAVSELVTWKLRLSPGQAVLPGNLDEVDRPALKYRLLWNWDSRTNWETDVQRMHAIHWNQWNLNEQGAAGYLRHVKRAIDFFSDHKLNGLTIWGFARPQHGGLEAARELCTYGRRNNVLMLPGVCPEAAYGGFTFDEQAEFNLKNWTDRHPDLRYKDSGGNFTDGICPSKPANQDWIRRGTRWFFEALPDAGGANVENGDWFYCWTDDCVQEKAKPENDPNFFWDQMVSYRPVLEAAREVRPDAWMVFATYSGFTENAVRGAMDGARQTKRAMGPALEAIYPPRMLQHMPANGICQWTLSGMVTAESWPKGAAPPASAFKEHIGYILDAGAVWAPSDKNRWWAGLPGSRWEEISERLQFLCSRLQDAHMQGLVMYGERGDASPTNELNYLALEYFGWHPERAMDDFIRDRLSSAYGGADQASTFLRLLRNTTRSVQEIGRDRAQASEIAGRQHSDVRQRRRWDNLADELGRRARLATEMPKQE